MNYANCHPDAPWAHHVRELSDFWASISGVNGDELPILANIRGQSHENLFEDFMHDSPLGVALDLLGSVLFELAVENVFGVPPGDITGWKNKIDWQLERAHLEFTNWCGSTGKEQSQPTFKHLTLSMHTLTDWPVLKAKAHNSTVVLEWLATATCHHISDERSEFRNYCVQNFAGTWHLVQATKFPNWRLSDSQARQFELLRQRSLMAYEWLSKDSAAKSLYRYKVRPKLHHFDHGLRRSVRSKVSPSVTYSFSPEDFMGLCARMSSRCHGSTIMRRGVARWLVSFVVGLDASDIDVY